MTRRQLLGLAFAGAWALGPLGAAGRAARSLPPVLWGIAVRNAERRYKGDRRLFATIAPGVPGRDSATVDFHLPAPATVRLDAVRTGNRNSKVIWSSMAELPAGRTELVWAPAASTPVGSYVMRLTVSRDGQEKVYGAARPLTAGGSRAPVVRVLGIEASFARRSYTAGELMELQVFADAPRLTLEFLRCGTEAVGTSRLDEMSGTPAGEPVSLDWTGKRSAPVTISVRAGAWPSGLYTARLTADDGRVGFAPFVVRPSEAGGARQAVVLPTNTWQAYNFYDADGDGWGDTWYAGGNPAVGLARPYRDRGVPPRFTRYDQPFLRWLTAAGYSPEFLSEDDLETMADGDELRRRYDVVVFPGHTEYVTVHEYDVIERFRDLGGRLVFLSANNFFWRVDRVGEQLTRVRRWRDLGRPEARLLGTAYRTNDDGRLQGLFRVDEAAAAEAPWFLDGTGLAAGSTFGENVGGYGIEIDSTTPDSPPGTIVLCRIPDLFGPGISAEMTYYETAAGARVFSAGALDFCNTITFEPMRTLVENVWRRMLD
jgi:hypothetical protein